MHERGPKTSHCHSQSNCVLASLGEMWEDEWGEVSPTQQKAGSGAYPPWSWGFAIGARQQSRIIDILLRLVAVYQSPNFRVTCLGACCCQIFPPFFLIFFFFKSPKRLIGPNAVWWLPELMSGVGRWLDVHMTQPWDSAGHRLCFWGLCRALISLPRKRAFYWLFHGHLFFLLFKISCCKASLCNIILERSHIDLFFSPTFRNTKVWVIS